MSDAATFSSTAVSSIPLTFGVAHLGSQLVVSLGWTVKMATMYGGRTQQPLQDEA